MSRSFHYFVKPTSVGAKKVVDDYFKRNPRDLPVPTGLTLHGLLLKDVVRVDEGCLSELCRSLFARDVQAYFAIAGETECHPFDKYHQKVKEVFVLQSVKTATA